MKTIGIIGGGQLGMMLTEALKKYGATLIKDAFPPFVIILFPSPLRKI